MKKIFVLFTAFLIASCGGGGGGGGDNTPPAPSPIINLSAEPTLVLVNSTSTLTWSSSNSTACSASWTNKTSTSGSEEVTISTAGDNTYSITCTGAGGSSTSSVTVEGYRNSDGVVVDGCYRSPGLGSATTKMTPRERRWLAGGTNEAAPTSPSSRADDRRRLPTPFCTFFFFLLVRLKSAFSSDTVFFIPSFCGL